MRVLGMRKKKETERQAKFMSMPVSYWGERKLTIKVTIKTQVRGGTENNMKSCVCLIYFPISIGTLTIWNLSVAFSIISAIFKPRPSRTFKVFKLHDYLLYSMLSLINPFQKTKNAVQRWIALHSSKIFEDGAMWSFSFALSELYLEQSWPWS